MYFEFQFFTYLESKLPRICVESRLPRIESNLPRIELTLPRIPAPRNPSQVRAKTSSVNHSLLLASIVDKMICTKIQFNFNVSLAIDLSEVTTIAMFLRLLSTNRREYVLPFQDFIVSTISIDKQCFLSVCSVIG